MITCDGSNSNGGKPPYGRVSTYHKINELITGAGGINEVDCLRSMKVQK